LPARPHNQAHDQRRPDYSEDAEKQEAPVRRSGWEKRHFASPSAIILGIELY